MNRDLETATRELAELARDKASKLDMLDDAEKRIENRLNEASIAKAGQLPTGTQGGIS